MSTARGNYQVDKPDHVFDRDREWRSLQRFVGNSGAAGLGLVYGRRRQGKTFLLESFARTHQGIYIQAFQRTRTQNLELFSAAYASHLGTTAPISFTDWSQVFETLLALERGDAPIPVVIDEFPYLLERSPELPSVLQSLLRPTTETNVKLILCGSALSTMASLLSGSAPLRGRASLELVVRPFSYRDAAGFWGIDEPELAVQLHALVGGTPAYLSMSGGRGPTSAAELDDWVVTALLDPASAMFREGSILVTEDEDVTDTVNAFSVLAAISQGKTRRGELAAALGRSDSSLTSPLRMLSDAGLITSVGDAFRRKRTTYRIAEPIVRFHQALIAPDEIRLASHRGPEVWASAQRSVSSRIYGPHFEELSRAWCIEHAAQDSLISESAPDASELIVNSVAGAVVACREHRSSHEIDVVVQARSPDGGETTAAIGEAKWRDVPCDQSHLRRLDHIRTLLGLSESVKLLLFSRRGFTEGLRREGDVRPDVELVDLDRLYHGT
jgi:uncharacterized protein